MPEPIISVERLGKCYRLQHQSGGARYKRFSESLVHWAKAPLRKLASSLAPRPSSLIPRPSSLAPSEDFWALKEVSFDIQHGEKVGIIGRNGAGKSTLLKILSRITQPTVGRAILRGRVASLLEVGTGFHPELTGRENIYLNGAILGMTKAEIRAKFDEIVAFADVEKFLDTPVKHYSSGMHVRLAFSVAAHLEPEILIVDEVLAVGDLEFQKRSLGKMRDVSQSGRTVIFVSHQLPAVAALCTRVLLLKDGQVQQSGPPKEVIAAYAQGDIEAAADVFQRNRRLYRSRECSISNAWLACEGCPTSTVEWNTPFEIVVEFEVHETVSLAPEYLIRDENLQPIAFSPTGLQQGFRAQLNPGRYRVSARCPGLNLASGTYYIDLMLADSGVRWFDYYECGLTFTVRESARPPNGWIFTQKRGQSCRSFEVELGLTSLDTPVS